MRGNARSPTDIWAMNDISFFLKLANGATIFYLLIATLALFYD
jgi:hypothetical protein